jgi:hypothetical protein
MRIILAVASGTAVVFGLAKVALRHGSQIVAFADDKLGLGWWASMLSQPFALTAMLIFWVVLLAPLCIYGSRR